MDVAEISAGEAWETNPFEPFIKDGWLVGRGAADMKGDWLGHYLLFSYYKKLVLNYLEI